MLETTPTVNAMSMPQTSYKKKLIEVALPLQAINAASSREKSIRHGHPSTLHLWWARRPLAACRAVLFASLVDDPSSDPDRFPTAEDQEKERKRLFGLIEELVQWENSLNEDVLSRARAEIRRCVGDELPTIYDPFCGGGAIPIEAQRLGLPTLASDLNPVAVLITKALTEIPWRFKGCAPVHPSLRGPLSERTWERATGLAADVEAYGRWMLEEARKRIGNFYPRIRLASGREATVIAWLWARTVHCNNPVCGAEMPLVKSFALSTKANKEWCVDPIVDRERKSIRFETRAGKPAREGTVDRRGAQCLVCGEPVNLAYIRSEGKAKRIGSRMLAIVAEGERGRIYLPPDEEHERIARGAKPAWEPDTDLPERALGFRVQAYGMTKHRDLFTSRQLLALTTFSDLVKEAHPHILADAKAAGLPGDSKNLESGGNGALAYADAVVTYLAMAVDKLADYSSTLCTWHLARDIIGHVFVRQTVSMTWDYAESNAFSDSSGNFGGAVDWIKKSLALASAGAPARIVQASAAEAAFQPAVFSTDPPYYDNVPYADLSDFFYVWLRSSLGTLYPQLLATLLVPKTPELVADPSRFGGDAEKARWFFEHGIGLAFQAMRRAELSEVPTTVFYAFKQTERAVEGGGSTEDATGSSVGWETMLSGLISAQFQIVGTWPMSSELANRMRGQNSNALASSIVLVCRPRAVGAPRCSRADFVKELRAELPSSVQRLREASLAATDLQQAALGPGTSIYSKYAAVLEPDDSPMSVRSALSLINEELAHILLGEISGVDDETHFALAWFDEFGYLEGPYGKADILLKAKNANMESLVHAGVLKAEAGRVLLLSPKEVVTGEDVALQSVPAWAQTMHILSLLVGTDGSDDKAAAILRVLGPGGVEHIKDVAYHCYLVCDRTKRAAEARDFNALVAAWPELQRLAAESPEATLL